jgi:hypothetical protein
VEVVFRELNVVEALLLSQDNLLENLTVAACVRASPGWRVAEIIIEAKAQWGLHVLAHDLSFALEDALYTLLLLGST